MDKTIPAREHAGKLAPPDRFHADHAPVLAQLGRGLGLAVFPVAALANAHGPSAPVSRLHTLHECIGASSTLFQPRSYITGYARSCGA